MYDHIKHQLETYYNAFKFKHATKPAHVRPIRPWPFHTLKEDRVAIAVAIVVYLDNT